MRTDKPEQQPFVPDPDAIEITDEKYHELREISIEMIQDTILGKVKDMAPVLFVHYRKFQESGMLGDLEHAIVMMTSGFGDTDTKFKTVFALGVKFNDERMVPAAVFMGSEAWISSNPSSVMMPRDDPDRKECIVIAGKSIGTECKSITMIPIGHDADGNIIRDGEDMKYPNEATMESPLLDQFYYGFFSKAKKRHDNEQRANRNL